MSRVHLASDTCDIYFSYLKVNLLLYTCSLDPFKDGILLDTPLVCMHRYCRNYTIREGSMEEKTEEEGAAKSTATERPEAAGRPTLYSRRMTDEDRTSDKSQAPDV